MKPQWLSKFAGTKWSGNGELWLDPEGNDSTKYQCELTIENHAIYYSWFYENERKEGHFTFNENGAIWYDSWHQTVAVQCTNVPEAWGIFTVNHAYEVPDNPDWGWRNKLSQRPDGSLVLQMTNITAWGEEGRAVRMVFTREDA
ncbi:DUF1579 family protein [Anoxynatronum buryatiense]|uniref:DUF1579 domain-containing protein n=1 Tax=Anoxynatronum buryatiense TaxID=489973 RepID=A0AA46AIX7_9CLOT|nr:DUF1579 family protein [Anoxynatronum buryatiense]SMP55942.1 Protein of unknown function [Anoxynatronum buryatiense]